MIAPQDMCIVCVCVCAKEQHSGFICFPFLMQSHSKSLTPIWFPYWLVSLFFLLSLIIQVYGVVFFSYFGGGVFLSLCSFDFILHGLRKLFNVKITTKRSKHNQSPKNDQWFSHAMVTLVVPFKVKYCLWNIPATFFWVLKIYSHFLRDPFETKGGCFPIKQEWALSTI